MNWNRINARRTMLLGGVALLGLSAFPAAAQTAPGSTMPPASTQDPSVPTAGATGAAPAADDQTDLSNDIVVTAQRREEKLSRVPLSVQAFSGEQLTTKVIVSEQDVGQLVPGLLVKNGQTSNQLSFSMRGQTLDPFSGTSAAVLTYFNEAPYSPYNTSTVFFDLGSVQVLKGPQGTLFGRNATGGAVLYTSPTPGNELSGNLLVRGGQRNNIQVQGAIDLPLIKDVLLVRVAGDLTKQDGYVRNFYTGNTLGDKDSKAGRITILLKPSTSFRNTLLVQYSDFKGTEGQGNIWNYYTTANGAGQQFINNGITSVRNTNGSPLTSTLDTVYNVFSGSLFNRSGNNIGDSNLTPGPAYGPGRFPGGVAGYAAWSRANPYGIYLQFDLPHRAHSTFISNTTELDVSDGLTIKNIFSFMDSYTKLPGNLAGGPFGALWLYNDPNNATGVSGNGGPGGQVFKAKTYSEELQLQGKLFDDRLSYTVGGFFTSFWHYDTIPVHVGAEIDPTKGAAAAFGLPADIDYTYKALDISKAVYAQLDYKITDKFKVTVGGRYTWESVGLRQAPGSLFSILGVQPVGKLQHRYLSAPSWTVNLQYQIDPQNMIYFAQRGSFRSGNFNGTVLPANDANFFGNEYAHDFEVGYKFSGRLGSVPFRFNLAAYDEIVKNAQHAVYAVVGGQPAGFTLNVPESQTKGVELDTSIGLFPWLDITATGAYTDAKYTKGVVDISKLTGVAGSTILFNSYPDTPKWSGSVGVDVTLPFPESVGKVILHGEVYGQTHTFFSSNEGSVTPGTRLEGYSNVNLRLSWNDIAGSKVSAGVYVKNVFNRLYYVSGYAMGAAGGYNTAFPGEPRTVAGELSFKF